MNKLYLFCKKNKTLYALVIISIVGFYFRTFNINWDSSYYFHPDERAIVMFTIPIKLPNNFSQFLSTDSPLNPHFFAYGNFPLYLLRLTSELTSNINPLLKEYGGIHFVGRIISALSDTITIILIFLIAKRFSKAAGLFASLFYALSVFPIQLSHFFAVDTLLTLFTILTLYFLIKLCEKPTIKTSLLVGLFTGLSLATKISSLIILFDIILVFLIIAKSSRSYKKTLLTTSILLFLILISSILIFLITQPYALIDFKEFLEQTSLQSQMSKNPFIFPYTLQYVGKIPYIYEIKNIFLWGLGPITSILCCSGLILMTLKFFRKKVSDKKLILILLAYFYSYFFLFGSFAVGWMRYMLPIYPILAIFGGYLINNLIAIKKLRKYFSNHIFRKLSILVFILVILVYPCSFLSIYLKPNTRLQASEWINKNIPTGSNLAIEHWDDALPVFGIQKYNQLILPLYDPDTTSKWITIENTLKKSDYIILASNRLYVPLQKLTDCKNLPPYKCYKITAQYYKNLFDEKLGFKKVAEFTNYPTIPFLNIRIVDDSADESFTVNDHPKIIIYEKIQNKVDLVNLIH